MNTRKEILSGFYGQIDEDGRLGRSRHGQLEYRTTMHYIHRYAAEGAKMLEVGAGTGRYSIALAKEGMEVTSVELVESNLAVLRENGRGLDNLAAYQGDATDLRRFADGTFDVTLVFGSTDAGTGTWERSANCGIHAPWDIASAMVWIEDAGTIYYRFVAGYGTPGAVCHTASKQHTTQFRRAICLPAPETVTTLSQRANAGSYSVSSRGGFV